MIQSLASFVIDKKCMYRCCFCAGKVLMYTYSLTTHLPVKVTFVCSFYLLCYLYHVCARSYICRASVPYSNYLPIF